MMRQRPPVFGTTRVGGGSSNSSNNKDGKALARRAGTKKHPFPACRVAPFAILLIIFVATVQLVIHSIFYGPSDYSDANASNNNLRGEQSDGPPSKPIHSYDVLLKNTVNYEDNLIDSTDASKLQEQINNLRSQIMTLESKAQKYSDDPRFFPFVIRDSRHLTPVQIDPDFHVFDYVDLAQAKQPRSKHSQLLHNARVVVDDVLEAKRRESLRLASARTRAKYAEKHEAPCQKYSIECYRQKILQVFSYVLRKFPSVEYYFYVEADNDLCVPMTMVRDLALNEKRYFIQTGIGFSGWIMSREFLGDFIELYGNKTLDPPDPKTIATAVPGKNETAPPTKPPPEIRPDVLASYYLTDKMAWTVTRQYWVSHTTLESLGMPSLTVKDRRKDDNSNERQKLDKHLPRCLEPRRGKWKVSRRRPYLDPRDRFGWDYFDYDVCPDEVLFPCGGPDQLKELVANDWKVANETGALAKWKELEEKRKQKALYEKEETERLEALQKKKQDEAHEKQLEKHQQLEAMLKKTNQTFAEYLAKTS